MSDRVSILSNVGVVSGGWFCSQKGRKLHPCEHRGHAYCGSTVNIAFLSALEWKHIAVPTPVVLLDLVSFHNGCGGPLRRTFSY